MSPAPLDISHKAQSNAMAGHFALIEEMIAKYSVGLEKPPSRAGNLRTAAAFVLLTGSTGNLGSQILATLLEDDRVKHVYALNRPSKGPLTVEQRQLNRFQEMGLSPNLLESPKLTFITGDTAQPNLGLDCKVYNHLSDSTNIIIHNAWKVNFNLPLLAFEPMIRGSRNLMDLLRNGRNVADARFLFTSSIGCGQSWPVSKGAYPEEIVTDASFAIGAGYGESKYVTERILANSGLEATSLRIGQISGGRPKGAWAIANAVPALVKSSVTIGCLPDVQGMISWVPMDTAAAAIVDAVLGNERLPQVANLVHPRPVKATKVIRSFQSSVADVLGKNIDIVSFREWLAIIEEHAKSPTPQMLVDIPAIRLIDFFRLLSRGNDKILSSKAYDREMGGLGSFSTTKMLQLSPGVMNELQSIGREDALLWVKYWKEIGYFA
ncbi:hypothetical protein C0991_004125 [Blastosporella zonata]|nr:hypothetical protein C0991_004125 [Blastosporella zonata]